MTTFRSEPAVARSPWRSRLRWLVGAAILTLLVLAGGVFIRARAFDTAELPPSLLASKNIPVTLPDGRSATLGDLVRPDRPTVINLWASWCIPCRREAPTIVELHQRFGDRINLLYLNVRDQAASREDLARYMAEANLPAEGYARLNDDLIRTLTRGGNNLVPRTLVFDRSGKPLASITGYKPLALARVAGLVGK